MRNAAVNQCYTLVMCGRRSSILHYGPLVDRGGEISKMYTCPRTSGFKKPLVRTNAQLVRTFTNANASI